jgi:DNA-binding SARP family transcriptional activator
MARYRRAPVDYKSKPEVLRIELLGGIRVSVGARTIEEDAWHLRKAASLMKLLALAPGHRQHLEQAMDSLWPDLAKRTASNNLRHALHAARGTLEKAEGSRYLVSENEALILDPEGSLLVDVDTFEETPGWGVAGRAGTTLGAASRAAGHSAGPRDERAARLPALQRYPRASHLPEATSKMSRNAHT